MQLIREKLELLGKLSLPYKYLEENEIEIFGKNDIYGVFLETGHFHLEKHSRRLIKWTCEGMQAVELYLRQHALNLPRRSSTEN